MSFVVFFFFKVKQIHNAHLHNQNTFLEKIEVVLFILFEYIYICIYRSFI